MEFREQIRKDLTTYALKDFKSRDVKLDDAIEQENKEGHEWTNKSKRSNRMRDTLEDEDWPEYDIQLHEAVRIAADWSLILDTKAVATARPSAEKVK